MRKAFATALGAALAGGLAWAALSVGAADRTHTATLSGADDGNARVAARRATDTYNGAFKEAGPGTKIKIKAKTRGGEPTAIKSVDYKNLPATCPGSGSDVISGGWTLAGVKVNDRRKFKAVGGDGDPVHPSSLKFTGKFSRNFEKVKGKFQTTVFFEATDPPDPLPEETCVSDTKRYRAKR